jgi:hypothetical protein
MVIMIRPEATVISAGMLGRSIAWPLLRLIRAVVAGCDL